MFGLFSRKKSNAAIVKNQYEILTNAARRELFYTDMNVPDTVMGRFNMLTIHLTIYLRHTRQASEPVKELAQEIVDAFFEDIDHSIREIGIGDASVPKRMKKLAKMFYGRADAYGRALDNNNQEEMEAALARNLFPEQDAPDLSLLAQEIFHMDASLKGADDALLAAGQLQVPDLRTKV